jgi:hypothetical protein
MVRALRAWAMAIAGFLRIACARPLWNADYFE